MKDCLRQLEPQANVEFEKDTSKDAVVGPVEDTVSVMINCCQGRNEKKVYTLFCEPISRESQLYTKRSCFVNMVNDASSDETSGN